MSRSAPPHLALMILITLLSACSGRHAGWSRHRPRPGATQPPAPVPPDDGLVHYDPERYIPQRYAPATSTAWMERLFGPRVVRPCRPRVITLPLGGRGQVPFVINEPRRVPAPRTPWVSLTRGLPSPRPSRGVRLQTPPGVEITPSRR